METKNSEKIKNLSFMEMLRYVARGMPCYSTSLKTSWFSMHIPKWPVFFSLLAVILYRGPTSISRLTAYADTQPLAATDIFGCLRFIAIEFCIFFIYNIIVVLWIMLSIKIFTGKSKSRKEIVVGAQKINYLGCIFQPLLFLGPGLAMPGAYYPNISLFPDSVLHAMFVISLVCGIVRILVIYRGIQNELGQSVLGGLFTTLGCIDVLFVFYMYSNILR